MRYTRAYLRHLFAAGELTAAILATHHNVHFYLDLMRQIREAIEFGNLVKFSSEVRARYAQVQRNLKPAARWPSSENRTENPCGRVARCKTRLREW